MGYNAVFAGLLQRVIPPSPIVLKNVIEAGLLPQPEVARAVTVVENPRGAIPPVPWMRISRVRHDHGWHAEQIPYWHD
jgi:hypothetical protein